MGNLATIPKKRGMVQIVDWGNQTPGVPNNDTADAYAFAQAWPASIARTNRTFGTNTLGTESFTHLATAYDGLIHAAYVARSYGPWGPNMVNGMTQPIQGSKAQAWWMAGIASIRNRLPGRP